MTLDRHAAERRRFARLLGMDGELGSGLPIGTDTTHRSRNRRHESSDGDPSGEDDRHRNGER